eukprot:UN31634
MLSTLYKRNRTGSCMLHPLLTPFVWCSVWLCFPLNSYPNRLQKKQRAFCSVCGICLLFWIFVMWMIFLAWDVADYQYYDRIVLDKDSEFTQFEKFMSLLYAREGEFDAQKWDSQVITIWTDTCGSYMSGRLKGRYAKRQKIFKSYIQKYDVDMTIYDKQGYEQFDSVNDWFYRHLKPDEDGVKPVRPIYGQKEVDDGGTSDVVVSVADCRLVVFPEIPTDSNIWIKNSKFSTYRLLDINSQRLEQHTFLSSKFLDDDRPPTMLIFRLAPKDYHRWHHPYKGKVITGYRSGHYLHSVNYDAITSGNLAIENERVIQFVE